jgi:hexosaminidase
MTRFPQLLIGLALLLLMPASFAANQLNIISNKPKTGFKAVLTVDNPAGHALKNWALNFNMVRPITSVTGANYQRAKLQGDLIQLKAPSRLPWLPGQTRTFKLAGPTPLKNISDLPRGFYVTAKNIKPFVFSVRVPGFRQADTPARAAKRFATNAKHLSGTRMTASNIQIIPKPVRMLPGNGQFILTPTTRLQIQDASAQAAAKFFAKAIAPALGNTLSITNTTANTNVIIFKHTIKPLPKEGYRLTVTPNKIIIQANSAHGYFDATQSLRQLLPPEILSPHYVRNTIWTIPAVQIADYPRFAYRGVLLDSARHMESVTTIKRMLDMMALLKLNRFHWHLTDDEAWRLPIKAYPQLTRVGAWRGAGLALQPALGSGPAPYGGFYTRAQIQDILQYAKTRFITVIPEVDLPGHSRALLKSLPQLSDPNDRSQYSTPQNYHDNVINPCLPQTYQVLDSILREVSDLFPSKIVHVGADEKPKGTWEGSPVCQAFMQTHQLQNTDQLQNYFENRIAGILKKHHKTMGGWEEITEGGPVPKSTVIYSWKGMASGAKAAAAGYPVVMTPGNHLYFDLAYSDSPDEPGYYWAGYVNTYAAYHFNPVPDNLSSQAKENIIGVQGALWSENIPTATRLDYLAFPKLTALAEVAWTPQATRQWPDFASRLGQHFLPMLDAAGIAYRLPLPGLQIKNGIMRANNTFPGLRMRYSLDGEAPTMSSPIYRGPIAVNGEVKVASFGKGARHGRVAVG